MQMCHPFYALSKVMIHDTTVEVAKNQVVVPSHPVASSLWLALMDMMQKGEMVNAPSVESRVLLNLKEGTIVRSVRMRADRGIIRAV